MLSLSDIVYVTQLGVLVAYTLLSAVLMVLTPCSRGKVAQHSITLAFALGLYFYGYKIGAVGSSNGAVTFKIAAAVVAFYYIRASVAGDLLRCEEPGSPAAPAPNSKQQVLQIVQLLVGYLDTVALMSGVVFALSIVSRARAGARPSPPSRPDTDPQQLDQVRRRRQLSSSTGTIRVKARPPPATPSPPQSPPSDDALLVLPPVDENDQDADVLGRLLG